MKKAILTTFVFLTLLSTLLLFSLITSFAQGVSIPVGNGPYSVLANPFAHEVYVANIWSDDVSVIDSLTDNLTTTIKVGPPYPGGLAAPVALAYNPNTNKLYVVNFWSAQLLAIDLATHQVEATISVSESHSPPRAVVVNPNTNLIYVTVLGRQGLVSVIDGEPSSPSYNEVTATIPMGYLAYPRSAAINTTLNRLYVANYQTNDVSVIDIDPTSPNFHQVIANVTVGSQPYALAVNHSTAKVYVANRYSHNVKVIDGTTNNITATISTGNYPQSLDINPDRNLIFVGNWGSNNVTVINGNDDTVTKTVSAGVRPYAIACIKTVTGNTYVTNHSTGLTSTVTIIDPTLSTTETTAGIYPASLSIDTLLVKPKVFVGNYGSNDVSVIDPPVEGSSLVTKIDPLPGNTSPIPTPVITGSSVSLSTPYPTKIIKVYFRLNSLDGQWKEAEITEGWGTSSVKWEINFPEPLPPGQHTIYVVALDMTGATIASTNGNVSNTPSAGKIATYDFEISPESKVMLVQDVELKKSIEGKKETLSIEVFIQDKEGQPVTEALVSGVLYTPENEPAYLIAPSDKAGKASFSYSSKNPKLKQGVYVFFVQNLEKVNYDYDSSLNQEDADFWVERPGLIMPRWILNALHKSNYQ